MTARPILGVTALLALVALLAFPRGASAQMADALGKPLADGKLPAGTVTVRVVAGALDEPVVGADVALVSGSAQRTARTDAEGRARFPNLMPGSRWVARVPSAEQGAVGESEQFAVPASGGLRLMLATVPWRGETVAAPAGAGPMASGMMDPRQMSGVPRPEMANPGRSLTVRAVQGEMAAAAVGAQILLIGYQADGTIIQLDQLAGPDGRATFEGLRTDIAYYAMAVMERDDGVYDRVRSAPITVLPEVGIALLLSGARAGIDAAPIDDMERFIEEQGNPPPAPGTVVVRLRGAVERVREVELYEVGREAPVARAPVGEQTPQPQQVAGVAGDMTPEPGLPAGALSVAVLRGMSASRPLAAVAVEVLDADGEVAASATTQATGLARLEGLAPGARYTVAAVVHGRRVTSEELVMPADGGGRITVTVDWPSQNQLEARLSGIPADPGRAYVAQLESDGQTYRSAPFQMAPDRGVALGILVFPRVVFRFHLGGSVDDRYMGFQGMFTIQNWSYAPYSPGRDGLTIPLPKGFVGAVVADEYQERVAVTGEGFLWRGSIPPGGAEFRAGFSLPVGSGGSFEFDMPLPHGAFDSSMSMLYTPGMEVRLPAGTQPDIRQNESGRRFYVLSNITILPKQRMVMSVRGLPHQPPWRRQVALAIGFVVLGMLVWALVAALRRTAAAAADEGEGDGDGDGRAALRRRREALLEKLVELDKQHRAGAVGDATYEKRRAELVSTLESVYAKLQRPAQAES